VAQRLVTLTDEDIELINKSFEKCPDLYSVGQKVKNKLSKSQRRITIASAKNKGREFQYFCAEWVSELLGIPYDQHNDDSEIQSRPMAQQGTDIVLRGKARELFPFDIEAKATKDLSIQDAVDQAEKNAGVGRFGIVFYRQTSQKPVVIMSLNVFADLYRRFMEKSNGN